VRKEQPHHAIRSDASQLLGCSKSLQALGGAQTEHVYCCAGPTSSIIKCTGSEAGTLSASIHKTIVMPAALQSFMNRFIQTAANLNRGVPNRSDSVCSMRRCQCLQLNGLLNCHPTYGKLVAKRGLPVKLWCLKHRVSRKMCDHLTLNCTCCGSASTSWNREQRDVIIDATYIIPGWTVQAWVNCRPRVGVASADVRWPRETSLGPCCSHAQKVVLHQRQHTWHMVTAERLVARLVSACSTLWGTAACQQARSGGR
jgi:hypothetical protein